MSRLACVVVPLHPHHVTKRRNGRRAVFFSAADREVYLGLLAQYYRFYSLRVLGYSLMTNHGHLVLVPEYPDLLARALREVHGRYSRYRHTIEQASGHLWQNRFYSCAFEEVRFSVGDALCGAESGARATRAVGGRLCVEQCCRSLRRQRPSGPTGLNAVGARLDS